MLSSVSGFMKKLGVLQKESTANWESWILSWVVEQSASHNRVSVSKDSPAAHPKQSAWYLHNPEHLPLQSLHNSKVKS